MTYKITLLPLPQSSGCDISNTNELKQTSKERVNKVTLILTCAFSARKIILEKYIIRVCVAELNFKIFT